MPVDKGNDPPTERWVARSIAHMSGTSGTARLDDRGRLVLPAALRRRLDMRPGDDLLVTEEADGVLRVESRRAAAHALIGLAGPADQSMVDELRSQRRREAAAEDADARRAPR